MRSSRVLGGACMAIGLFFGVLPAGAQNIAYLAGNCTSCHGPEGRSTGETPALAGLAPAWFVEQMALFRDGKRQGTIMNQLSKGYTEAQVGALAEWFSKQQASTGEAPK